MIRALHQSILRPRSAASAPTATGLRARGLVIGEVVLEWTSPSPAIDWDVYEYGEHSPITMIATTAGEFWQYGPLSQPTQSRFWVLPTGSPAPTDPDSYMCRIMGDAPLPNGIQVTPASATSSLSVSAVNGGGFPEFCFMLAAYAPGITPDGWRSYSGSMLSWDCGRNTTGNRQTVYVTVGAEDWGKWQMLQELTTTSVEPQGLITSQCEGYDMVHYEHNGYGYSAESGRDVNSPSCGYSPEPPPEPPPDPDNDGDGVPASSDPDDSDPNNPNPQP